MAESNSATHRPPRRSSSPARRSTRHGSPPRPTLPSASSTVCHGPSRAAARTRRGAGPARRCVVPVRPRWRTGRHRAPARRARPGAATKRPGPQPKSIVGPSHSSTTALSNFAVGVASAEPAVHRQPMHTAVVVADPASLPVQRAVVQIAQHVIPRRLGGTRRTDCRARMRRRTASTSSTVSTSANSATRSTSIPVSRSAASVTAPVSGPRHRDRRAGSRPSPASVTPSTHHPPSRAMPSTASRGQQCLRAFGDQFGGHLRGIHPDLQDGETAGGRGGVGVRVGQPLGEVVATLRHDGEIGEPGADLVARAGVVQIAGQRHHPGLRPGPRPPRPRCPAARRRRCRRRPASPTLAASRVFACPGTGALATTSTTYGDHEITRQKSSAAMKLPRTDPLTFDLPPVRGPYATSRSTTRQPALRRAHQQFQRIARPAVGDAERQQRVAAGDPHRRDVVHRQPVTGAQPPAHRRGAQPRVPRPAQPVDRRGGVRSPCRRRGRVRRPTPAVRAASRDPSASRTATIGVVAATTPACTAEP